MGRIRPTYVKRAAKQLLERYPNMFSTDFEHNCQALEKLARVESKPLKNKVAGYITALLKQQGRRG